MLGLVTVIRRCLPEEMRLEWIAALTLDLRVQLHAAVLAAVAVHVVAFVHRDHARHFRLVAARSDHLEALCAAWREPPRAQSSTPGFQSVQSNRILHISHAHLQLTLDVL